MTEGQFKSRREMREAQSGLATGSIAKAQTENQAPVSPQLSTTGVVNPYAPIGKTPPAQQAINQPKVEPAFESNFESKLERSVELTQQVSQERFHQAPYEPVLGEAEEPITAQVQLFSVSPNLSIEPQTASIIIDNFEPLDNISVAISETGELLKTGSIELPNISTHTGQIATILDAAQVDEAITKDSIAGYVSTIAPLRASGVVNTSGKIGIMPTKNARGRGPGYAALTLSILIIAVGGLVLAAFMLGFLK